MMVFSIIKTSFEEGRSVDFISFAEHHTACRLDSATVIQGLFSFTDTSHILTQN